MTWSTSPCYDLRSTSARVWAFAWPEQCLDTVPGGVGPMTRRMHLPDRFFAFRFWFPTLKPTCRRFYGLSYLLKPPFIGIKLVLIKWFCPKRQAVNTVKSVNYWVWFPNLKNQLCSGHLFVAADEEADCQALTHPNMASHLAGIETERSAKWVLTQLGRST